jgi:hypothetical protein
MELRWYGQAPECSHPALNRSNIMNDVTLIVTVLVAAMMLAIIGA